MRFCVFVSLLDHQTGPFLSPVFIRISLLLLLLLLLCCVEKALKCVMLCVVHVAPCLARTPHARTPVHSGMIVCCIVKL